MFHIQNLLGRLLDGEAGGRLHFNYLVPAGVQVVQVDDAVFVRVVVGAVQFLISAVLGLVLGDVDFKLGTLDAVAHHAVDLVDGEAGLFLIFNGNLGGLTGPQIDLVGRGVQNIARRSLLFGDDIIALGQVLVGNRDASICAHGEVADFDSGLGLDLKNRAGEELAIDVHLGNFQSRPLVVLELHSCRPVGEQCHGLGRGIQDIIFRDILLRDGVGARKQIVDINLALSVGGFCGDGGAVCTPQGEGHAGNRYAGVLVGFLDNQVGPLLVLNTDCADLSREQFHMVLPEVQNMVRYCGGFFQGVHTGFQTLPEDFAILVGGPVQVAAAVLNLRQPEGYALQGSAVRTGFQKEQIGLFAVCKDELRRFVRL